jgi:hypothetical protein
MAVIHGKGAEDFVAGIAHRLAPAGTEAMAEDKIARGCKAIVCADILYYNGFVPKRG